MAKKRTADSFFEIVEAVKNVWRLLDEYSEETGIELYQLTTEQESVPGDPTYHVFARGKTAMRMLRWSRQEERRWKAQRSKRKENGNQKKAQARKLFAAIPEAERRGRLTRVYKRIADELKCSERTVRGYLSGND